MNATTAASMVGEGPRKKYTGVSPNFPFSMVSA